MKYLLLAFILALPVRAFSGTYYYIFAEKTTPCKGDLPSIATWLFIRETVGAGSSENACITGLF